MTIQDLISDNVDMWTIMVESYNKDGLIELIWRGHFLDCPIEYRNKTIKAIYTVGYCVVFVI